MRNILLFFLTITIAIAFFGSIWEQKSSVDYLIQAQRYIKKICLEMPQTEDSTKSLTQKLDHMNIENVDTISEQQEVQVDSTPAEKTMADINPLPEHTDISHIESEKEPDFDKIITRLRELAENATKATSTEQDINKSKEGEEKSYDKS
jgi:hypothetical protein